MSAKGQKGVGAREVVRDTHSLAPGRYGGREAEPTTAIQRAGMRGKADGIGQLARTRPERSSAHVVRSWTLESLFHQCRFWLSFILTNKLGS